MFPGNINPKQMAQMMRKLGIKNEELEAKRVIIELSDGRKLIIENPSVQSIEMQGQKTYTIAGLEKQEKEIPEEDISLVVEQTGVTREEAKKALEENNGNIAEAIISLKKN